MSLWAMNIIWEAMNLIWDAMNFWKSGAGSKWDWIQTGSIREGLGDSHVTVVRHVRGITDCEKLIRNQNPILSQNQTFRNSWPPKWNSLMKPIIVRFEWPFLQPWLDRHMFSLYLGRIYHEYSMGCAVLCVGHKPLLLSMWLGVLFLDY